MESRKKIIIADDEKATLRLMSRILRSYDWRVEQYESSKKLQERLSGDKVKDVAILITDNNFGIDEPTGNDIALELRARCPDLPIRLQSGMLGKLDVGYLNKKGIDTYSKPFDLCELNEYVGEKLNGKQ